MTANVNDEHLLLQRQLRCVGHVIRMPSNRLPRRILYGELVNGQRLAGGHKLRYMDHICRILEQVKYIYCKTGAAFNWPRHMEKCLCHRLCNIQSACRSSSWGSTYPQAQSNQPTHQLIDWLIELLVRYAHSAAESVLPSSACAAIYGVMLRVHISNTPSSTNVIVELDGLLQAS